MPRSLERLKSNEIEFAKMYFKKDKAKLENLKRTVSYSLFEKTTNKDSLGIYMLNACNELDCIKK
jgi:transposase